MSTIEENVTLLYDSGLSTSYILLSSVSKLIALSFSLVRYNTVTDSGSILTMSFLVKSSEN